MTSRIVQIAKDVTELLSSGSYSIAPTITRRYRPVRDFKGDASVQVTVMAAEASGEHTGRANTTTDEIVIDVAVQAKLDESQTEIKQRDQIDSLMAFAEEIADRLRTKALPNNNPSRWAGFEVEPLYDPEHLLELRQFTQVYSVTYRQTVV